MLIRRRFNIWSFMTGAGFVPHVYVAFNTLTWHVLLDPEQYHHRQTLESSPASWAETTAAQFFQLPPDRNQTQNHHQHHHKAASLFPDSCQANMSAWNKIYEEGKKQPHSSDFNNDNNATTTTTLAATKKSRQQCRMQKQMQKTSSLQMLQKVIQEHAIETMIDIPCGGDVHNWILDSWETDGVLKLYVGLDVVPDIITANQARFAHNSNKVFQVWDGTKCPMPRIVFDTSSNGQQPSRDQPVDLIHTRGHVLQHLSLDHSVNFLCNVLTSNARFFVTTMTMTRAPVDQQKNRNHTEDETLYYQHNHHDFLSTHPFHWPSTTLSDTVVVSCEKNEPSSSVGDDETAAVETCIYDLTQP